MSSNAIVSFIPGFRREGSGSESPSGFKRASFIAPSGSESPYLDLAQLVLPPMAKGLFMVSLFAIVMSTVDSFSFISAFTIGKDLTALLNLKHDDTNILRYTRWGLVITAL